MLPPEQVRAASRAPVVDPDASGVFNRIQHASIATKASENIQKLGKKIRALSLGPWLACIELLIMKAEDDYAHCQESLVQQNTRIASLKQEKEFREQQLFDKIKEYEELSTKFECLGVVTHPSRIQQLSDEAKTEVEEKYKTIAQASAQAVTDAEYDRNKKVKEARDRAAEEVTEGMKRNLANLRARDQMWLLKNKQLQEQIEEQGRIFAQQTAQHWKAMIALERKYEAQLEKNKMFAQKLSNARKLLVRSMLRTALSNRCAREAPDEERGTKMKH